MTSQVCVILPTYNRANTLARAINSVLEQTYTDFELVVIDDASSDDTNSVLSEFNDKRLHVLHLPKRCGAAGARNFGISKTTRPFVAFQDSDDQWLPEKLGKQMAIFDKDEHDVSIVYSDMMRVMSNGISTYLEAPEVNSDALINPVTKQYCVENLGIGSCVIKRECFEKVGNFNEDLPALEDLELFVRLSMRFRFHRIPEALVNYYETEGNSSDRLRMSKARRMLLKLFSSRLKESRWFIASELSKLHP